MVGHEAVNVGLQSKTMLDRQDLDIARILETRLASFREGPQAC